jgi:mono/diheme cytochrome c family protein
MTDKPEPRLHGTYVEFDSVDKLLPACRRIRDAGYTKTDAYTPFPVHGIDKALGIKPTVLPWICLVCGLTGTTIAVTMQIWMNAIDYPYIISGKPFISMPAFIPVSFELTVLLASFGAFFGMLALNKLPRFSNPVFTDPRFDRATDDRFFLFIEATDPKYDKASVTKLFGDMHGGHVDHVYEDTSSDKIPRPFWIGLIVLAMFATVPPLVLSRMLVTKSTSPRFHVFYDMDFSPAKGAQQTTTLFADGRASRPDVPGTVAVGQYDEELDFYTGIDMDELTRLDAPRATRLVRALLDEPAAPEGDEPVSKEQAVEEAKAEEPKTEEPQAEPAKTEDAKAEEPKATEMKAEPAPEKSEPTTAEPAPAAPAPAAPMVDNTPWLKENPLEISTAVLQRGREKFEIYCAVCHGNDGAGNGLVNRRAQRILATAWVQPSSMHQETLYADQYADGKLFNTITNGIRKMPGYASQISTKDRWGIVAYVRALQASQNASLDDLPADRRNEIRKQQAEVQKRLAEQAEQEKKKAEEAAKKS